MPQWKAHPLAWDTPAMVQMMALPLNLTEPQFSPVYNGHNNCLPHTFVLRNKQANKCFGNYKALIKCKACCSVAQGPGERGRGSEKSRRTREEQRPSGPGREAQKPVARQAGSCIRGERAARPGGPPGPARGAGLRAGSPHCPGASRSLGSGPSIQNRFCSCFIQL